MYYKFNGFTQRLIGSGASVACSPQGFKPTVSVESSLISATSTRPTLERTPPVQGFIRSKAPELQKLYQNDGLRVHLKRGLPDQLLYRIAMTLTIGGTISCLIAFYMMAKPERKKE
ncbi:cytochrome c oxidase subunit 7A2-like, mitochondrial [Pogona vitticeps]|uniref:Cytochrome c oxidase subunit 7A2-like, mitochondrial n=1 Tax=Pogona vitticeps TaxID=103695 RepID=A0A6J0UJE0_9SAUR|nr:cytochrome c oxidase subunit 7A-related protein, mitochondrial [Pogona vitticeps]